MSTAAKVKTHTGHVLIETARGQWIEPATFYPNGLAVHRAIGLRRQDNYYTVTHVRSGAHIRSQLKRMAAKRLADALQDIDFTFDRSAVTTDHAERVRAAYDQVSA